MRGAWGAPVLQTEAAFILFGDPANCTKPSGFARSALVAFSTALFLRLSHRHIRALPRRY